MTQTTGPARVLHVVSSLNRGGIETWLQQTVRLLPRNRYQCDFCTYRYARGAYAGSLESYGCRFYHIPLGSGMISAIGFVRALRALLHANRYDVVHSHGLALVGLVLLVARLEGVPVRIAHGHNLRTDALSGIRSRVVMPAARLAARCFATAGIGCSREAVRALFGASGGRKYGVLHCGIDLMPFRSARQAKDLRAELGIGRAKVVGLVASFTPQKNHQFLISVFAEIYRRDVSAYLLLVGDGPLRSAIERQIHALGLSARVILAGQTAAVPEFLKQVIDVFVMTSTYEGLPLAVLEAQAAGVPCVVSEAVTAEAKVCNGFMRIPLAKGPKCWADAILSILHTLREPHSRALKSVERSDFNLNVSASRLDQLYAAGLARARAERSRL